MTAAQLLIGVLVYPLLLRLSEERCLVPMFPWIVVPFRAGAFAAWRRMPDRARSIAKRFIPG